MRTHYRGLLWPAVLILVGLVALLANAGVISSDRLSLLVDLWPLVLVVIGLELIARRGLQGAAGEMAAVLIVLVAVGGALAYVALAPNPGGTGSMSASAPVGNLEHADLEIDVGAATITVQGGAPEGDLYRATIDYSGPKPQVSLDTSSGRLKISQGNTSFGLFRSNRFTLRLLIDSSLPWTITTNSGAATDTYNLSDVHVGSISLNTGASREDITLGRPSGVVPISINGGALTVNLHRPAGVAASVRVSGGAVSLAADGETHRGIGSQSWQSSGFGGATDAYRVEVNGGACTVSIDTAASAA
jgi:hypothetical protein